MRKTILIGTRASRLAKWQSESVMKQLQGISNKYRFKAVEVPTQADEFTLEPFTPSSFRAYFKELQKSLESGDIDLAIYSMRDLPYNQPPDLSLAAIISRSDPSDVLISNGDISLNELPLGARVGTSSSLRRAQILKFRSDFNIFECRGYIDSRIERLKDGKMDCIVLAAASIERLGLDINITEYIPHSICMPAAGQAAVGVQVRSNDNEMLELVRNLHNTRVASAVTAERTVVQCLGGKRYLPIGALAQYKEDQLQLQAIIVSYDGQNSVRAYAVGDSFRPEELGHKVAESLLSRGGDKILENMGERESI